MRDLWNGFGFWKKKKWKISGEKGDWDKYWFSIIFSLLRPVETLEKRLGEKSEKPSASPRRYRTSQPTFASIILKKK